MFLEFFYLLRLRGLEVSINEWLTLVEALDKAQVRQASFSKYGEAYKTISSGRNGVFCA